ncbi:MAG: TlyA family rRNA (cytidine-2'-O)-methyltransferase [Deltaproteobacteria bacterium]|nr:TlyA family rRNA (cytidine-2'-O)-methyltransferase [Deltaproteobacteria bacterium]
MAIRQRLDLLLVERQLAPSRERAQSLIMAGKVLVNAERVDKPGKSVNLDSKLVVQAQDHPYVSRGGVKLAGAIREFQIEVLDRIALDVGASTGGFTDCLLQHGAEKVYAVDVGYGQLAWKLRQDPRVVNLERKNIRYLDSVNLADPIQLVVVDASFISLRLILPKLYELMTVGSKLLALVKPQFEAGRKEVGKGGRVKEEVVHARVLNEIIEASIILGFRMFGSCESSIQGKKGQNTEYFVHLEKPSK